MIFRSFSKVTVILLDFFQFILLKAFLGKNRSEKELILVEMIKKNPIILQKRRNATNRHSGNSSIPQPSKRALPMLVESRHGLLLQKL